MRSFESYKWLLIRVLLPPLMEILIKYRKINILFQFYWFLVHMVIQSEHYQAPGRAQREACLRWAFFICHANSLNNWRCSQIQNWRLRELRLWSAHALAIQNTFDTLHCVGGMWLRRAHACRWQVWRWNVFSINCAHQPYWSHQHETGQWTFNQSGHGRSFCKRKCGTSARFFGAIGVL